MGETHPEEVCLPEFLFRIHDGVEQQVLKMDLPDQDSAVREAHAAARDIVAEMLVRRVPGVELLVELHHAEQAIARIKVVLESTGSHQLKP